MFAPWDLISYCYSLKITTARSLSALTTTTHSIPHSTCRQQNSIFEFHIQILRNPFLGSKSNKLYSDNIRQIIKPKLPPATSATVAFSLPTTSVTHNFTHPFYPLVPFVPPAEFELRIEFGGCRKKSDEVSSDAKIPKWVKVNYFSVKVCLLLSWLLFWDLCKDLIFICLE